MLADRQPNVGSIVSTTFDADEVNRFKVALSRITKGVDRTVGVDGMTRTQLSVLGTVVRLGPLTATELAQHEGLNPTMVSRMVGKLAERGLVTRSQDPDDGRVVRVAPTSDGRTLHRRLRRDRSTLFAARLREVGDEHSRTLLGALPALEALAAAMSATVTREPAGR
jgi:DNA-binding MarR family transcriptional regulator